MAKHRVLLVDDDPDELFLTRRSLDLSDHPKPATDYHLKTGQRE
jgi:hypothetical protein